MWPRRFRMFFNGVKREGGEAYSGYVPSASARGGLAGLIGDDAQSLKPAAGDA